MRLTRRGPTGRGLHLSPRSNIKAAPLNLCNDRIDYRVAGFTVCALILSQQLGIGHLDRIVVQFGGVGISHNRDDQKLSRHVNGERG